VAQRIGQQFVDDQPKRHCKRQPAGDLLRLHVDIGTLRAAGKVGAGRGDQLRQISAELHLGFRAGLVEVAVGDGKRLDPLQGRAVVKGGSPDGAEGAREQ
jgi:hypothetical protein